MLSGPSFLDPPLGFPVEPHGLFGRKAQLGEEIGARRGDAADFNIDLHGLPPAR